LLVDPSPARSWPSIPRTSLHLETFSRHITRTSLSPPFPSPWPALEPKQRPRRRFHCHRQIVKVRFLRSAKGHLLTLAGNRPQGIQPRKGSSQRATRRAERNRPTTPSPQVRLPCLVLYGSEVNIGPTESAGACPEQRSQAQALNRTLTRGQPRHRPRHRSEATTD
jgi:hypothetical protein